MAVHMNCPQSMITTHKAGFHFYCCLKNVVYTLAMYVLFILYDRKLSISFISWENRIGSCIQLITNQKDWWYTCKKCLIAWWFERVQTWGHDLFLTVDYFSWMRNASTYRLVLLVLLTTWLACIGNMTTLITLLKSISKSTFKTSQIGLLFSLSVNNYLIILD